MNHTNGEAPSSKDTTIFSQLVSLPKLKVVREEFASEKDVDQAVDLLEANRPDLIRQLLVAEYEVRISIYKPAGKIVEYLTEGEGSKLQIPRTHLALLDIVCEISRRLRRAYDLPEIKILGHQLAPSIAGPYPELPKLEIDEYTAKQGLTQEETDRILELFYSQKPELWFAMAEQDRRQIRIYPIDDAIMRSLRELLLRVLNKEPGSASQLRTESYKRIYNICMIAN